MDRLGDRVETIERKAPWGGQPTNTGRNPNFRKNQNQNTGRLVQTKTLGPLSKKLCRRLKLRRT